MDTDVLQPIANIFLPSFIGVNMRGSPLILTLLLLGASFSGCFGIIETTNNTNFENSNETLENTTISENETVDENETTNENQTANENETVNEIEIYPFSCMGSNEYCYRSYDNFTT